MKQVLAGETIHSVYGLGGTLLYRDNASTGERTDYIALGGHPVGRFDAAGGFTWTAGDHLGSASLALDGAAGVLWRESYTPFGEVRNNPAVNRDEAGFTGHVRDQATGLTYAQARYYNPVTARFLSPDPVGFAAGGPGYFNRYAYTMNDPVNMTDPDGKEPVPLPGGGAGRTFFLPESSFTHISNRHGPSGSARQRFSDGFAPPSHCEAGILAGAVIAGGEEYFQPSRGSKTFMLNTGTAIGQNGEIAVTVVTRPLSDPDDPALVREVTSGLMENGAPLVDPSTVHVVITIAPDDGSMRDRNAVLIPRNGDLDEN